MAVIKVLTWNRLSLLSFDTPTADMSRPTHTG